MDQNDTLEESDSEMSSIDSEMTFMKDTFF
jgi:hypothetical protein